MRGSRNFFQEGRGGASVIIKNLDKPKKKPNYQNYEILNPWKEGEDEVYQ